MATTIRLATDQDGPAIWKLFAEADHPDFGVDWTAAHVRGWWLVAEAEGRIVGVVQAVAAQPFGYIGEIIVHPDYRRRETANGSALTGRLGTVAYDLLITAFVALRAAGSQMVVGAVGSEVDALRKVYERHGAMNLGQFTLMGRRLT